MELILKISEICDWSCSFCSSSDIANTKRDVLDLDHVKRFLKRFPETNTIIINGGEPLMVKPSYYWELLDHLDEINSQSNISFTSNLWNFYNHPEKWIDIFKHPRVGVTTSFNYGNTRTIAKDVPYTEKMFWKVSDKFLELVGYRPDFISVVNEENYENCIDNVRLAERMGVENKLNYSMASGRQGEPLILAKIYRVYLDIIKAGLSDYEYNTKQLLKRLNTGCTTCPQNRTCDSGIRAFNPGGSSEYYSCGSIADDRDGHDIDFELEMSGDMITPLSSAVELVSLKTDCLSCPLFKICNGCYKTIKDMKEFDMVEKHCGMMKEMEVEIINISK